MDLKRNNIVVSRRAVLEEMHKEVREERFLLSDNGTGLVKVSSLGVGTSEFSFLHTTGIHKYSNDYESRTVSLHLYVKPVKSRKIYDCSDGFCKTWSEECEDDSVCVI